jgi:integrase
VCKLLISEPGRILARHRVFPSKKARSGHIELSGLEHRFRKIARDLGISDDLKIYCARHTFGTVAMAETKNPGLVKDVMGHESLQTTMQYLHPETAQIKTIIDRRNLKKMQEQADQDKKEDASTATKTATGGMAVGI